MTADLVLHKLNFRPLPAWLRRCFFGFLYWLGFLLVLEPDNLFRASHAGQSMNAGHEVLRLLCASALGACATPAMLRLVRRFPLDEGFRWRNGCFQLAAVLVTSLVLILASCFLAAWVFGHEWSPSASEIHDQLVSNWLLLVFALGVFLALAHLVRLSGRGVQAPAVSHVAPLPDRLARVPVKTRGRLSYIDLADVDWIETQGNYLALHVAGVTHLIRETSTRFETQIDPERFVRIHRRILLAVDRVRDVRPEANGDATVRLLDGRELRASRRFREALRQKMAASPPAVVR